jgi:signal transduction histidine kinase
MMQERAESVGAFFSVTSQPGHGAELTINWKDPEKKEAL